MAPQALAGLPRGGDRRVGGGGEGPVGGVDRVPLPPVGHDVHHLVLVRLLVRVREVGPLGGGQGDGRGLLDGGVELDEPVAAHQQGVGHGVAGGGRAAVGALPARERVAGAGDGVVAPGLVGGEHQEAAGVHGALGGEVRRAEPRPAPRPPPGGRRRGSPPGTGRGCSPPRRRPRPGPAGRRGRRAGRPGAQGPPQAGLGLLPGQREPAENQRRATVDGAGSPESRPSPVSACGPLSAPGTSVPESGPSGARSGSAGPVLQAMRSRGHTAHCSAGGARRPDRAAQVAGLRQRTKPRPLWSGWQVGQKKASWPRTPTTRTVSPQTGQGALPVAHLQEVADLLVEGAGADRPPRRPPSAPRRSRRAGPRAVRWTAPGPGSGCTPARCRASSA